MRDGGFPMSQDPPGGPNPRAVNHGCSATRSGEGAKMDRTRIVLGVVAGMALLAGVADGAKDPVVRCGASKLKATGRTVSALLRCHGQAVGKGLPGHPACLSEVNGKFVGSNVKAEGKGGCAIVGDAPAVAVIVGDLVTTMLDRLPGDGTREGNRCASSKLKAAGRKADGRIKCYAKAFQ